MGNYTSGAYKYMDSQIKPDITKLSPQHYIETHNHEKCDPQIFIWL